MNFWPFKRRDERGRFVRNPNMLPPGEEEEDFLEGEYSEVLSDEPIDLFAAEKRLPPPQNREVTAYSSPQYEDVTLKGFRPGSQAEERVVEEARRKQLERESTRASELRRKAARRKLQADIAKSEIEMSKAKKARFDLTKDRFKTGTEMATRAAALGGVPSVQRKGGISDMYFGRAGKNLYVPSTPTQAFDEEAARSTHRMDLGVLREAGAPPSAERANYARRLVEGPSRTGELHYGFLRQLALPTGTSKLEQAVFAEIQDNHDVDTMDHIKVELAKLGYQRGAIENAVRSLEGKGFIERRKELPAGPQTYEVR